MVFSVKINVPDRSLLINIHSEGEFITIVDGEDFAYNGEKWKYVRDRDRT